MKNKITILLFSLLFAISAFGFAFAFNHSSNPVYAEDSSFGGGAGTSESPYQISTTAHLGTLASDVAGGNTYAGKYFKLMDDISYEGVTLNPIGTTEYGFSGVFDGNGCVISDISYEIEKDAVAFGLFAYTKDATITNLGIENVNITSQILEIQSVSFANIGVLIGFANNTIVRSCYVSDDDADMDFNISSSYSLNVGGLIGRADFSLVSNCYANIDMCTSEQSLGTAICCDGSIVGMAKNTRILSSYSSSNISSKYDGVANANVTMSIGGIVGYVEGSSNSELKNLFFVGSILCPNVNAASFNQGTICGQITETQAQTPAANSINFCHAVQVDSPMPWFGALNNYSTSGLKFLRFTDVAFQTHSLYLNETYWDDNYLFDFDRSWSFEANYPVLQQFCSYIISIEQVSNCTIYYGDETTEGGEKLVKSGQPITLRVVIDEEVKDYYSVSTWKHRGVDIAGENEATYEFICSFIDSGTYSIVLKPVDFSVAIAVATEQTTYGGFKYGGSGILQSFNKSIPYGQTISLIAVPSMYNGISYAFDGWYIGTTLISTSENYEFNVGDELVERGDAPLSFSVALTAKFTQDTARLSISFDGTKGKVKLSESAEFSSDQIENKVLKLNGTYTLYAEANDGYVFEGWFSAEDGGTQLSKDAAYTTFVLEADQTTVFARFALVEDAKKDGLSGWAIFGIIAGSLAVVASIVLAIIFGKRRTNYKSGFNF